MGASVLYMSMSADGFITGPNVRPDNGLGDQGQHLHDWVFGDAEGGDFDAAIAQLTGVNRQIWDETMETGAVLAGRHTFEPAGGWNGDHHDGVEIFIVSRHEAPEWVRKWKNVHYIDDLGVAYHYIVCGLHSQTLWTTDCWRYGASTRQPYLYLSDF